MVNINISKNNLEELYNKEKYSIKEIADKFKVSESLIHSMMKKFGITRREQKKRKMEIPKKEILEKFYYSDHKTLKEIGKIFNTERNMVGKWFKHYDLKTTYFKKIPNKKEIIELYNKLNLRQISEFYQVSINTTTKWFKTYNIKIKSTQQKYSHLRKISFTQKQKEFIVGTTLGDGYINPNNLLEVKHSIKQIKYLLWKKEIMSNYVNYIRKHTNKLKKTNKIYETWSWHTIRHQEFSFFRELFYKNNKKIISKEISQFLTPFSMAIWIMDDGWRQNNNIKISSECFSIKDHKILKKIIKSIFNIDCRIYTYKRNFKKYNNIFFDKKNSILLSNLIKPFIIDCMEYKIIPLTTNGGING